MTTTTLSRLAEFTTDTLNAAYDEMPLTKKERRMILDELKTRPFELVRGEIKPRMTEIEVEKIIAQLRGEVA